jgi:hypothetical protein
MIGKKEGRWEMVDGRWGMEDREWEMGKRDWDGGWGTGTRDGG